MGMYTWLGKDEIERYSSVTNKELNELFQEVRALMPDVFISERIIERKPLFGKKTVNTIYSIYHLVDSNITSWTEVRCMNLNFSNAPLVFNYLCGLHNGYNKKTQP